MRLRSDGARIFLASSGKSDDVERAARLAGVEDLVDGAATSEDAARSKPAADIFKAALERAAPAPASSTAAVGDTPFDAKAALGAGVAPIGVVGGVYGEAELRAAGCRALYRDLEDLLRRMDQSPLAGAR